jgi:hypothetical protein
MDARLSNISNFLKVENKLLTDWEKQDQEDENSVKLHLMQRVQPEHRKL